jgi:hypothetical protein
MGKDLGGRIRPPYPSLSSHLSFVYPLRPRPWQRHLVYAALGGSAAAAFLRSPSSTSTKMP